MGYTHYWEIAPTVDAAAYKKALTDIRKIVRAAAPAGIPLGDAYGEGTPCLDKGIAFNGVGDDAHETCALDATPKRGFDFTKTAQKPYDMVVVATLARLSEVPGVRVSSDGDRYAWEDGVAFAARALGRDVPNPIDETEA